MLTRTVRLDGDVHASPFTDEPDYRIGDRVVAEEIDPLVREMVDNIGPDDEVRFTAAVTAQAENAEYRAIETGSVSGWVESLVPAEEEGSETGVIGPTRTEAIRGPVAYDELSSQFLVGYVPITRHVGRLVGEMIGMHDDTPATVSVEITLSIETIDQMGNSLEEPATAEIEEVDGGILIATGADSSQPSDGAAADLVDGPIDELVAGPSAGAGEPDAVVDDVPVHGDDVAAVVADALAQAEAEGITVDHVAVVADAVVAVDAVGENLPREWSF